MLNALEIESPEMLSLFMRTILNCDASHLTESKQIWDGDSDQLLELLGKFMDERKEFSMNESQNLRETKKKDQSMVKEEEKKENRAAKEERE